MKILGIETSCDETAASIVEGNGDEIKVISNVVSSQIEIHKKYNGVVPEVAAREHVLNIIPVINEAVGKHKPDIITVANGPGLITSLMTGVETAKTLAYAWNLPIIAVNHVEAHIYSCFIDEGAKIKFPAMFLTVSGGHTMIVLMEGHGKLKTIGDTLDDAAGEAFDKGAKLMGLGYPGGPILSKIADEYQPHLTSPLKGEGIIFPRPMLHKPNFNFSFSGLKTSLLYKLQKDKVNCEAREGALGCKVNCEAREGALGCKVNCEAREGALGQKNWKKKIPEYCFKYQEAIVDVLVKKTIKAAKKYKAKTVCLSGGVSANKVLRETLAKATHEEKLGFVKPDFKYTTDNAVMVATAGYFKTKMRGELRSKRECPGAKKYTPWQKLKADCNLNLF